ncbi:hypothetical protein L5M43_02350 [Shewanella sp. SW36]|uniref:hypothetical protein n=2 Tax=Shewanellaceae TaxID=267890 RepID=UPI0021D94BAE|nr:MULTISPECIES: hypothetical protein [unclassified Shewanella]MCU7974114.1 hypothetical protein [Shewanella sp. SW36]MCU7989724.1 hypothetical protein [Shewanella sp. SW1]MCU8050198.1 hypothetical protein [Shewanella sp. SM43]
MIIKRRKVKSTAFSDFVRNASSREKSDFFKKVIEEAIQKQKEVIAKANEIDGQVYVFTIMWFQCNAAKYIYSKDENAVIYSANIY